MDDPLLAALAEIRAVAKFTQIVPERDGLVHAAGVGRLPRLDIERLLRLRNQLRGARILAQLLKQADGVAIVSVPDQGPGPHKVAGGHHCGGVPVIAQGAEGLLGLGKLLLLQQRLRRLVGQASDLLVAVVRPVVHLQRQKGLPGFGVVPLGIESLRRVHGLLMLVLNAGAPGAHSQGRGCQQKKKSKQNFDPGFAHGAPPDPPSQGAGRLLA